MCFTHKLTFIRLKNIFNKMKLVLKEYKIIKTKNYFKKNNLFILLNGTNKESSCWVTEEQYLKKINFSYSRIFNRTSKKTLNKSVYKRVSKLINSLIFLIKYQFTLQELSKQRLINSLKSPTFTLLALKLNNKIYSKTQIESLQSLSYKENKLLFFHSGIINSKCPVENKFNFRNNVI